MVRLSTGVIGRTLGALALGLIGTAGVRADTLLSASASTAHAQMQLLSEQAVVAPGTHVALLLQQQLKPGWHTYWRNPGDTGLATQFQWHLPAGVIAGALQWPTPERFLLADLVNYGYEGSPGIIAELAVPATWPVGQPLPVAADVSWLVCADLCVPEQARFSLSIPTGPAGAMHAPVAALFAAARAAQPQASPWAARVERAGHDVRVQLAMPADEAGGLRAVEFFPGQAGWINASAPTRFQYDKGALVVSAAQGEATGPVSADGVLVLHRDGARGAQRLAIELGAGTGLSPAWQAEAGAPRASGADMSIGLMLLSALAGGLLLNLMPCVFPVLAMKSLALLGHANEGAGARIRSTLAYALGVLVSFALLGIALLSLRAGGAAVGWGFQLQNPIVVVVLVDVLFASALNLSGLFEFGTGIMGVGGSLADRDGALGSFFTGVLAAVVATPCTAPFMATALGAALAQPAWLALLTMVMLGFGLALPFLLIGLFPVLARWLPRPGAWMGTLKQLLAFPMYASAAWLVWVLAQQRGPDAILGVLVGLTVLALGLWLSGLPRAHRTWSVLRAPAVALLVLSGLWLGISAARAPSAASTLSKEYSAATFDALRAEGKPVFLELTAAWCITCKVNERVALSGSDFRAALARDGVTYLVGDWTREDPAITRILTQFGRAGVPLYVLYPAQGDARVLPQVLTESMVVAALDSAAKH